MHCLYALHNYLYTTVRLRIGTYGDGLNLMHPLGTLLLNELCLHLNDFVKYSGTCGLATP